MPDRELDALDLAAEGKTTALQQMLSEHPGAIALRDEDGRTALHYAALWCEAGTAEILLRFGAEVDIRDRWLYTPLMLAAGFEPLALHPPVPVVRVLLSHGANPNAADENGNTALHYMALWSDPDSVRLLIEAGANVRMCNGTGETPLHYAAIANAVDTAKILLSSMDTDAEVPSNAGELPSSIAARHRGHELAELIRAHSRRRR